MKNNTSTRKSYYTQLLIQQERLNKDILNGYYKSKCVIDINKLIRQETQRYLSKLEG